MDPAEVTLPDLPEHLRDHPVSELVRQYRETRDSDLFDKAARMLVPDSEEYLLTIWKS